MFSHNLITRLSSPTSNGKEEKVIVESCLSLEGLLGFCCIAKRHRNDIWLSPLSDRPCAAAVACSVVSDTKVKVSHYREIFIIWLDEKKANSHLVFRVWMACKFCTDESLPEDVIISCLCRHHRPRRIGKKGGEEFHSHIWMAVLVMKKVKCFFGGESIMGDIMIPLTRDSHSKWIFRLVGRIVVASRRRYR